MAAMKAGFHDRPFDDATQIKLAVFGGYMREWISLMLTKTDKQFKRLRICDFFAGPGVDGDGNPGSPLIAMAEVMAYCKSRAELKADIPLQMIFCDADSEHVRTLEERVQERKCREGCCSFEFCAEPFSVAFARYRPQLALTGSANLVILDQFGVKEVTPETLDDLLSCGRTDVMFFISSSFVRRFIDTPEIRTKFSINPEEVGNVEYKAIHRYLCAYYRSALRCPDAMLAPFSIKKGSNIYGIIFATRHRSGMDKFLSVCWKIDPSTGQSNYDMDDDPAWGGEQFLLPELNTIKRVDFFEKALLTFIGTQAPDNVELDSFCLAEGFSRAKASESLRAMQNSNRILIVDATTGAPARRGSFYLSEADVRVRYRSN